MYCQLALIFKAFAHKYLPILFALIFFFAVLPSLVTAQTTLPSYVDVTTPGVTDYIVPSDVVNLIVTVAGAQGGSSTGTCLYQGGKGWYWAFQLPVSYCSLTRIAPGGTLRLITGGQGCGVRRAPDVGAAGGGGGSALLYKAPSSSDWIIIAVAGGGGGASFLFSSLDDHCAGSNGKSAVGGNNGTAGVQWDENNPGGAGGTNGNGGYAPDADAFGGGGAFSDGVTTGNQGCTGKKGYPSGGAQGNCNDLFTYFGGFGFGSGGAGITGGGGGGGYSGGGGGASMGGGGGGSYLKPNWYSGILSSDSVKTGDGEITILCATGTLTPPVSLASSALPARQVLGCSLANCFDFGYSVAEKGTTLQAFNAAGGNIVSGGCGIDTITYHDSAANENPIKTVYRTYTVTDVGNNKAIAKQTINITDPGIAATMSPASQVVCGNVKPATITANVTTQFGITMQWYQGDNAIFSEATPIPGATSVDYSPPATSVAGVTYYFAKMTDGCGLITVKKATVTVGQAVTWYKDLDNDNYYDSSYHGQPTCTKPGAGYKFEGLLGIDCNDNDATITPQTVWVLDADGDGYYSGSPYTGCLPNGSTGYVKKTTQLAGDCNDNDASVHPGATEVLNGKDDNCDGKIDEGLCDVTSNLTASNITSSSATVSWDSALNGSKYNLSYKADNASTWTVVKNIKKSSYNLTGLPLYYTYSYKVQTVCPYNDKSAYSKVAKFNTTYGGPVYCTTQGNTYYEYINKVVVGSAINNTSGDNNGYGDYNGLNATVSAGGSYTIKLTPGYHSGIDTEYWEVYVDYNQDGLFKKQDGERVVTGRKSGTLSKNFTIPFTAKNGFTRMRIMMHFDSALNQPCGNFNNGEAEDYTLIINGGTGAIAASGTGTSEDTHASTISSLLVIPNPVNSSSATAVLNLVKEGSATVRIIDLYGRTLYKKEVTNLHTGKNSIALSGLAALSNGTYFIEAEQNGIMIGRGQVVINK